MTLENVGDSGRHKMLQCGRSQIDLFSEPSIPACVSHRTKIGDRTITNLIQYFVSEVWSSSLQIRYYLYNNEKNDHILRKVIWMWSWIFFFVPFTEHCCHFLEYVVILLLQKVRLNPIIVIYLFKDLLVPKYWSHSQ